MLFVGAIILVDLDLCKNKHIDEKKMNGVYI